jgi:hypothetical protein
VNHRDEQGGQPQGKEGQEKNNTHHGEKGSGQENAKSKPVPMPERD